MGWSTTWKRKEWAIGWLIKLIADRDMTIHDPQTYDEMRTYVTLPNGGAWTRRRLRAVTRRLCDGNGYRLHLRLHRGTRTRL